MKSHKQSVPGSVRVASLTLFSVPAFTLSVSVFTESLQEVSRHWPVELGVAAIYVGIGLCLAKGFNWARLGFAGVLCYLFVRLIWVQFFTIAPVVIPSLPIAIQFAFWAVHFLALILCFTPKANSFFRPGMPNHLLDPTSPSVTPPAGAGDAPSVAADH